jgi:hypothetical protein
MIRRILEVLQKQPSLRIGDIKPENRALGKGVELPVGRAYNLTFGNFRFEGSLRIP